MPPFLTALIIQSPGPDRSAIAGRLRGAGFVVNERDDARFAADFLVPLPAVIAVEARALAAARPEDLAALRVADAVVMLDGEAAPAGFRRLLHAPFFIEELWQSTPLKDGGPALSDEISSLLRGLAHALSNRAQAADGWAALIELTDAEPERRALAVKQLRAEMTLIGRFAQGLALLGGRPVGGQGAGAADAATAFALEAAARGARVERRGTIPATSADPEELAVVAALILADRDTDAAPEASLLGTREGLRIELPIGSPDLFPRPGENHAGMLGRIKRTSDLGVAVAMRLAARCGGTCAGEATSAGAKLILIFPALRRETAAET